MASLPKIVLALIALLAGGASLLAVIISAREPSLDRTWDEDVRVLTPVTWQPDGRVRLEQVREWQYTRDAVVSKAYRSVAFDPADVQGLWLYEQELGLGGRIAHTFLVFEFPESYGDDRWLGISVETRRELGETYSIVGGMMRRFELTHIWAREDDLVRRRVEFLDYPLTRFRVTVDREYLTHIFRRMVDETADLAVRPRWYNTLTTNCTSALISYVNEIQPGAIPRHRSFALTGLAAEYLAELGYVDLDSREPITRERLAAAPLR